VTPTPVTPAPVTPAGRPEQGKSVTALWYTGPGQIALRSETLVQPDATQVLVATEFSGVSRGTERLIMAGKVGQSEWERMRAPLQAGSFPFPVKYGYCATGVVEQGPPELTGRRVFVLAPHQDRFIAPASMATVLPDGLPSRRATLAANMETALNAMWDSGAGPADRIVIVGGGIVGLLIAYLAAALPGAEVTVVDVNPARGTIAASFGAAFAKPADCPGDADVVFHATASAPGLATAIGAAGFEGTVVEVSWFGDGPTPVPLGGAFHSRRLRLVSSQVGHVASSRRARWTYARRMAAALRLLADPRLDALITAEIAFTDAPAKLPPLLSAADQGLAPVIRY
jgi:2-desacetyl-2-hydroxyethyl bacteriochlorophyllide A dehydrogenase